MSLHKVANGASFVEVSMTWESVNKPQGDFSDLGMS
jgi:hypothetical protein